MLVVVLGCELKQPRLLPQSTSLLTCGRQPHSLHLLRHDSVIFWLRFWYRCSVSNLVFHYSPICMSLERWQCQLVFQVTSTRFLSRTTGACMWMLCDLTAPFPRCQIAVCDGLRQTIFVRFLSKWEAANVVVETRPPIGKPCFYALRIHC